MLWDRVGFGCGWVGRGEEVGHVIHIINQYPSLLIINSPYLRQFLRWGTSRSAKIYSQFLRNLIFIPFTKVASAFPSINNFQICWCHMIDETFSHPYI